MLKKVMFNRVRVLLVKQAIEMWMKHKMQITRGFTISMAMEEARAYTGKKYKAKEYEKAIKDLNLMLNDKVVSIIKPAV